MKLSRYVQKTRIFLYKTLFSDAKNLSNHAKLKQATQFVGKGRIELGDMQLGCFPSPNFYNGVSYLEARDSSACITIQDGTFINNNCVMIAERSSIHIGKNCLLGPNLFITDSDFHGINVADRRNGNHECQPVVIEDDVFIGADVKIMKGVRVGEGAVIGSGSVVVRNVLPRTLVAGVPAKLIREIS